MSNATKSSNPEPGIAVQAMYVVVSGLAQDAYDVMVFGGLGEYCGKLHRWISINECSGNNFNEVNAA